MNLHKLVADAMSSEKIDKNVIAMILTEGIANKENECCVTEKVYRATYNYLLPELCEELISGFSNEEKAGSIWSIEDTNNVARKLEIDFSTKPYTPSEFRAAMHMKYYEHNIPLKKSGVTLDPTGWGRLAEYCLNKKPKKLIDYYFCK